STPSHSSLVRDARRRSALHHLTIAPSSSTPASPATATIVSSAVHVATVCGTDIFRYSFTSQNPPSLTWEAIAEPAPMATTSSSLLTWGSAAAIGAMILAAVTTATVTDPTARRRTAAITQPRTSGE